MQELEQWKEGVGLILRGRENSSGVFCSGGDLKTVDKIADPEGGFKMSTLMGETTSRLLALPLVSVSLLVLHLLHPAGVSA